jgi:RNA polymerase sigma-70 factor (ECF subfamily)
VHSEPQPSIENDVHVGDQGRLRELVDDARTGDRTAFAQLYDVYLARVRRYVAAQLGPTGDIDDVTADTFVAIWRALPTFNWTGAPFAAWVFAIARQQVAMSKRSFARKRSRTVALDDLGDTERRRSEAQDDQTDQVERALDLHAALATLDERQREVIVLRFFADMPVEAVAETMELSPTNVRQIQLKALERLRMQARRQGRQERAA